VNETNAEFYQTIETTDIIVAQNIKEIESEEIVQSFYEVRTILIPNCNNKTAKNKNHMIKP
jgi:5-formaminoimidazole-4-carboxamide-1-beta-D-ribofuranosyl 5'-monophosphate synthetase